MPITALADRRITVRRRTAHVLDPVAAAASHVATRQPSREATIEVRVTGGTANTGTVTVLGTVGGAPDSEVLTFAGAGRKATIKRFSALASPAITTTGLADEVAVPTIEASAVAPDGTPVHGAYVVVSGWPMRMDRGRPTWPAPIPGSHQREDTTFYMDATDAWMAREGDTLTDDRTGEVWSVKGQPTQHGGGLAYPHHLEIRVVRDEGRSTT